MLQAMLSQIVDSVGDNTCKNQQPRIAECANCSRTESKDFMVMPKKNKNSSCEGFKFQMPLHYPRYKREDYEKMEEWKVDQLLGEYGLVVKGSLEKKRYFAMGAFLWPGQM